MYLKDKIKRLFAVPWDEWRHYGHSIYMFALLMLSVYLVLYGVAIFQNLRWHWMEASFLEHGTAASPITLGIYLFLLFVKRNFKGDQR